MEVEIDNEQWMRNALQMSLNSGDPHKKVGCILVYKAKYNRSIGIGGYNHIPRLLEPLSYKDENDKTRPEVIHAEYHVMQKLLQSSVLLGTRKQQYKIFCTLSPCMDCAKLIYISGIKELYYNEEYKDPKPMNFLKSLGVVCQQIKI